MSHTIRSLLISSLAGAGLLLSASTANAFDEAAAKALFKENDCGKCHATSKDKKGPSLKKIAKEHAGKKDAEAELIKHMTTGPRVKLDDGSEDDHKIIDTKDQAKLKNLSQWILAQ